MATKTIPADDEPAILARANEIYQARTEAALAEKRATYAPLIALVDSAAFKEVRDGLLSVRGQMATAVPLASHLNSAANLLDAIASQIPADARPAPSA